MTTKKLLSGILFFTLLFFSTNAQVTPKDLSFNIKVKTNTTFNNIQLSWNKISGVNSYNVYRKKRQDKNFTLIATNLPVNDSFYTDNLIAPGSAYEYAVQSATNSNISGYVYAGNLVNPIHNNGTVLLMIDSAYMTAAQTELALYKKVLIQEGWKVEIAYAGRSETPQAVKSKIMAVYNASNNQLKGVVLLGHIPVPYSGSIAPDTHADHVGAWPSDTYYADMCGTTTGMWTDQSVNTVSAADPRNINIVGDGKFDLNAVSLSTSSKIFVGRVDVYNMPTINANDVTLFKQYLNKNIAYRTGQKEYRKAGIVDDNFGYFYGEAFAQYGWKNMNALVGAENVSAGDYLTSLKANTYLWSYGCGGGWYSGCNGVGTTSSFKANNIQGIFTMLYGSYFGDFDNTDNFLRAPIASPSSTLVSCWVGRPAWYFHTMSMGEPIGYSYISSLENTNTYFPLGYSNGLVHISIQGDPTLRMYMYKAPTNVFAQQNANGEVYLQWTSVPDPNVLGYYVYKSDDVNGKFQLLNSNYITNNNFTDFSQNKTAIASNAVYLIRAVKLEQTTSGSFYNLSPGVLIENITPSISLPVTITSFEGIKNKNNSNTLVWQVEEEKDVLEYIIERSEDQNHYTEIAKVSSKGNAFSAQYNLIDFAPADDNYYRLTSIDIDGKKQVYSEVVYINNAKNEQSISFYPNPVVQISNLKITNAQQDELLRYEILDITGKVQISEKVNLTEGDNIIQLQLYNLSAGNYFLRYQSEDKNLGVIKFQKL